MAIYSVHIPADGADPATAAERANFLREGFSLAGFPVRAALAAGARALAPARRSGASARLSSAWRFPMGCCAIRPRSWLYFVAALFLGLEGKGFVGAALERRGFALVDVAAGADLARRRERLLLALARRCAAHGAAAARAAAGVRRADAHVIGLFPEAGG